MENLTLRRAMGVEMGECCVGSTGGRAFPEASAGARTRTMVSVVIFGGVGWDGRGEGGVSGLSAANELVVENAAAPAPAAAAAAAAAEAAAAVGEGVGEVEGERMSARWWWIAVRRRRLVGVAVVWGRMSMRKVVAFLVGVNEVE